MKKTLNKPKLSICITTRNRGDLITETLESIVDQIENDVEVVVVDGASTDNTGTILKRYADRYLFFRYIGEDDNSGLDSGYDSSVVNSKGDYCWVMTDDDLLAPGAVRRVLSEIKKNYDLIIVNIECFNTDMSIDLKQKLFNFDQDIVYGKEEAGKLFTELGIGLSFIGSVVIKRSLWLNIDRSPYFGTEFVHVGVIFENNFIENALLISDPYILYRSGNSAWTERSFQIWYNKWPKLIWSFSKFSDQEKAAVVMRQPWFRLRSLLRSRAMGQYSRKLYYQYIATEKITANNVAAYLISIFPSKLVNFSYVFLWSLFRRSELYSLFNLLQCPSSSTASRIFARALGINVL